MAHGRFPPCCFSAPTAGGLGEAVATKVSMTGGPRGRGHVTNVEGWFCYLYQFIIPPVIIRPPPKTRTSNKTTMTVPMTIATVLVLVVLLLLLFTRHSPSA